MTSAKIGLKMIRTTVHDHFLSILTEICSIQFFKNDNEIHDHDRFFSFQPKINLEQRN